MKESPILFSTEMVQSIVRGDKTQTRRVVKPQPTKCGSITHFAWGAVTSTNSMPVVSGHATESKCPYGKIGDLLWVRETHLWVMLDHAHDLLEGSMDRTQYVYKSSVHEDWIDYAKQKYGYKWKPSIHMPKAAARIWLRITNIRVERLHKITEEDAIKEGVETLFEKSSQYYDPKAFKNYTWYGNNGNNSFSGYSGTDNAVDSFTSLWYKINGEESWNANPYVWVIEFEVIYKTSKP